MIDMPDDLEIQRQRAADQKEARRLETELATHAAVADGPLPTKAQATEVMKLILCLCEHVG